MADELAGAVKQGGGRMTIFGVITILLGVGAMSAPLVPGLVIAKIIGFVLLAAGVARMIWAFSSDSFGQGVLKFAIGGLTLLCGLAIVGRPFFALASITIILAFYFIIDGIFEVMASLRLKPESGWGFLLFGGVVSLALGVMIWRDFPTSAAWVVGVFVGIKLLFAGLAMVTVGSAVRAVAGEATHSSQAVSQASEEE
jgi:uncharacterized membrane protein HdeD (DUF308 family)